MTDKIRTEVEGGVGWIVFNNPERHNAVSLEMWQGAHDAMRAFMDDDAIRLIGITGAGDRAFISGADISKFESERAQAEAVKKYDSTSAAFVDALASVEKPTLARINGYCLGGGLNIAICCDLRIASDDSQFGIPAAKLGLGYGYKGFRRLADVVGLAHAREIAFLGERFDAARAHHMGLITRLVPKARLDDEVARICDTITGNAPLTVRAFKIAALEHAKDPADRDLQRSQDAVKACFESDDYKEGRRAFMEKRKPNFQGR
jgi:enoyl-CoA hydratase